jgi:clan AA aspartic protease
MNSPPAEEMGDAVMIMGVVVPHKEGGFEVTIEILVRGPTGKEKHHEAVLDTGFNGFLTLPAETISSLALPYLGTTKGIQADGKMGKWDVFEATVLWDGQERSVPVLASEGGALVGMAMVADYCVNFEVRDGGSVTMETLS